MSMIEPAGRQQKVPPEDPTPSHEGIAARTLRAMWPSDSLEAVDHIGHAARLMGMKGEMASLRVGAGAADRRTRHLECLVQDDYGRFHADDTFSDLKRRARFSKEDKGVLRDWLALAGRRERALVKAMAIAAE